MGWNIEMMRRLFLKSSMGWLLTGAGLSFGDGILSEDKIVDLSGLKLPETHYLKELPSNKTYQTLYDDIMAHGKPARRYESQMTDAHEAVHDIKAKLTTMVQNELKSRMGIEEALKHEAFYLLDDKYIVLKEPGLYKSEVSNQLPAELNTEVIKHYLLRNDVGPPPQYGHNSLYIFDEWIAGINEVYAGIDLMDNGLWKGNQESLDVLTDFTMMALAYATHARNTKPEYWARHQEFGEFTGYNLVRAKGIYDKATGNENYMRYFSTLSSHHNLWRVLSTGNNHKTVSMRQTVKNLLGDEYKSVFNF
jgi:hypothetical protein